MKRALREPLRQIAENAGEEGAIVLGKVNDSKDNNFGYNALTGEYEDLVKAGVLDPTKVVRTALQNAGSIASLMLTTEALVAEIPEEKKGLQPAADTAAAWETCTKKLSSFQPSAFSLSPARKRGAFCLWRHWPCGDGRPRPSRPSEARQGFRVQDRRRGPFLSPLQGCIFRRRTQGLRPWAALWRRSAAGWCHDDGIAGFAA